MRYIKIGELFKIKKGKRIDPVSLPASNTVRYIQIEDLRTDENYKSCILEKNHVLANKEDIIIAWDGANAGTVNYGLEGAIGSTLAVLISESNEVFIPYIGKFLQSKMDYFQATSTGATIPHISRKALEDLEVPLPSITVQKQVSLILEKAQELIDNRNNQIEALEQLTQSVFLEMFGDPIRNNKNLPIVQLIDIASIIMGQSPKGDSYNNDGIGVALLNGPTEFGEKYPVERQWTTDYKKLCIAGDLLFCVRGATAGRMNFADKEYCIGRGLAAIRCDDKNKIPFIYQTLKFLYSYFHDTSNGSTFINIDKKRLEEIPIFNVNKQELEAYFKTMEKIDTQKTKVQGSLVLLKQNYQSLVQIAFKGDFLRKSNLKSE